MIILSLFILLLNVTPSYALSAQSSVLMDAASGRVLMESNARLRRGMASTTKIMTALVAIEHGRLDDIVTVSGKAASVEGSSMWLKPNEKISLKSLLYGLMLNSGNDAATAIAEHIGGSVDGFAALMNEKARQLGLRDTSFANPHGLDNESHYTTAYELGLITCHALKNDEFCDIVNTKRKTIEGLSGGLTRTLSNHNKMLSLYDNADGVKTGFTKKCGRCLVSSATRDGMQLVAVTLNAPDDWNDHSQMLNFGFSRYKKYEAVKKNSYVKTVQIQGGTAPDVAVYASSSLAMAVKDGELPRVQYNIPDEVKAPVIIGQKLGTISLTLNEKTCVTADVLAKTGVPASCATRYLDIVYYLGTELLCYFSGKV